MSLKENIDMVKDELNSEEKLFENSVKFEYFVKKYKNIMIASGVVIALAVGGNTFLDMQEAKRVTKANEIFLKLQQTPNDKQLESELKSTDETLFNAYALSNAIANSDIVELNKLATSKSSIISDLATYQSASISKKLASLESYTLSQNAIYKDLAIVEIAVLLIKEGKVKEAHEKLKKIQADSAMYQIARTLLHYKVA
ncbi:MAG: hypothetical protein GQ570_09985 [Helicobacteraceae bacterium]|nr:hypothetical protein [Helicobacteraceae bacterium]